MIDDERQEEVRPEGEPEPEAESVAADETEQPKEEKRQVDEAERALSYWGWRKGEIRLLDRQEHEKGQEARKRQEEKIGLREPESEEQEPEESVERTIMVVGPLRRMIEIRHGDHVGQEGLPEGGSQPGFTHVPGSVPGSGEEEEPFHAQPGFTYDERIEALRDYLRPLDHEEGFIIDSEGNIISVETGSEDLILWSDEAVAKIDSAREEGGAERLTLVHNHPKYGSAHSPDDIIFTYMNYLDEAVVVSGKQEITYTAILTDAVKDFRFGRSRDDLKVYWNEQIAASLQSAENDVYNVFRARISTGEMTTAEAESRHYETMWERLEQTRPDILEFRIEEK